MNKFKGAFAALLTPYDSLGNINHRVLKEQVRWLIGQGIDGFYVCGSTGEAFLLSPDERKAELESVCEANNGEKTVIAHVGEIATEHAVELARHAERLNVDAISSISPFYYKFSKEEIMTYYGELMESVDLPFFIYNFPKLSGFSITLDILEEMRKYTQLAGVKFTDSDFYLLERMKRAYPELCVWNGYDEKLLCGLSMGADGGVGSTYNVLCPAIKGILSNFEKGNMQKAQEYQHLVNDMITVMSKCGNVFSAIKTILTFEGMDFGGCRKPFHALSQEDVENIEHAYNVYLKSLEKMKTS